MAEPRPSAVRRAALGLAAAAVAAGCGTHARALPFGEARALCEALLPQVSGPGACRLDELAAPARRGAEPRYDVETTVVFRPDGRVERFEGMRASGPAADPAVAPADCAAQTVRHLSIAPRPDALVLPVRLQYREAAAAAPAAAVLADGRCALTIPAGQ